LHVHSNYSFCRGANSIQQLCAAAQNLGMTHLALTETNGVYGLGWFLETAKDFNLKPIIGVHLVKNGSECVVLAKNIKGYQFICKAVSRIHHEKETPLFDIIKQHNNVFLLSNDLDLLKRLTQIGKLKNVYGELRPFDNREQVLKFCRQYNIPPVATNGVFFIEKNDWHTHHLLRAIDLNTTLKRVPEEECAHREAWFRSAEEMIVLFPDCPEAISNTLKIAKECEFNLDFGSFVFTEIQGTSGKNIFTYFKEHVNAGILWRYGELTPAIEKRRDYELQIIKDKGFAIYFLVLADVTRKVKLNCGRGSAAASLVSYALGITHVDPIKHNLFFERFLNEGRQDPPDIDVDFAWDERDTVLKYLFDRYGAERTAMIANHNTFKARSAVREIAKVYGLPDNEIGAITKRMTSYWQPEEIWKMTQSHPIYKETEFPEPWPEIISLAEKIRGYPRHMSLHCGGVVIAPKSLDHYVPY
jgi:error-prone DNA polymerase